MIGEQSSPKSSYHDITMDGMTTLERIENGDYRKNLAFTYAIVLNHTLGRHDTGIDDVRARHEAIATALLSTGLKVALMEPTEESAEKIILVVGVRGGVPDTESPQGLRLLYTERRRLQEERFTEFGAFTAVTEPEDEPPMTASEENRLTHRIIRRGLGLINIGIDGRREEYPSGASEEYATDIERCLEAVFPLHDHVWNKEFVKYFGRSVRSSPVDHIRKQFGVRVAMYYAFMGHYTVWLLPLTIFCALYYVIVRLSDWPSFARGQLVVGFFTACVWSTLMTRYWHRKSGWLVHRWGLDGVRAVEFANPHQPEWERRTDPVSGRVTRVYDPRNRRWRVTLYTTGIVIVNMVVLVVICVPFVQWYIFGKMAPTCECCQFYLDSGVGNGTIPVGHPGLIYPDGCDPMEYSPSFDIDLAPTKCRWWSTCFTAPKNLVFVTDRWYYILLQGMALGLVMDVAQCEAFKSITTRLVRAENWATEKEYQRSLIRKQFFFMWYNMYFWFFAIAFAYVPFGPDIQEWLKEHGLAFIVPAWGWRRLIVNIDEAFVTPLVATQSINLALETIIPVVGVKIGVKAAAKLRALRQGAWNADSQTDASDTELVNLARDDSSTHQLERRLQRLATDNLPIYRVTPDLNALDATDIYIESQQAEYDPQSDYLDMMMQLGYVSNFTQAWALLPVCATVNNLLEVRGDAVKMCFGCRRPVPRPDVGTIEWQNAMYSVSLLAIAVTSGLIALSTGQMDYWYPPCVEALAIREQMAPNLECISWGGRLLLAIILEHVGVAVFFVILAFVKKVPKHAREAAKRDEERLLLRLQESYLPMLDEEYKQQLHVVFNHFDVDKSGTLQRGEVTRMIRQLTKDRQPTDEELQLLFHYIDGARREALSFAEVALALAHVEDDAVLKAVLGRDQVKDTVVELATAYSEHADPTCCLR